MDLQTSAPVIRRVDRTTLFDAILASFASLAVVLAVLAAAPAAHARSDSDADLVPDYLDNCNLVANGPNQGTNQVDSDLDGYGNRCDTDYHNTLTTTSIDFGRFLECLGLGPITQGGPPDCLETDHDGSSTTTINDFGIFLGKFSGSGAANRPGPSGLACAGSEPCQAYLRRTFGATDTLDLPNAVVSPTDYDLVTFQVPAGYPGQIAEFKMVVGAPGGLCDGGAQCYAEGQYALTGWNDLAEAVPFDDRRRPGAGTSGQGRGAEHDQREMR